MQHNIHKFPVKYNLVPLFLNVKNTLFLFLPELLNGKKNFWMTGIMLQMFITLLYQKIIEYSTNLIVRTIDIWVEWCKDNKQYITDGRKYQDGFTNNEIARNQRRNSKFNILPKKVFLFIEKHHHCQGWKHYDKQVITDRYVHRFFVLRMSL